MELLWTTLGIILILAGLLGSFLPVLPGPPISYGGLLLIHYLGGHPLSLTTLLVFAVLTSILLILDYYLPVWTTKKFGGSKAGQWGATIGVLLGLFAGPWGIVLGPLIGAYLGELFAGRNNQDAWNSAKGAFLGFLMGTGLKIMLVGAMLWVAVNYI
ncbi:MAG: hypothetical protein RLZZ211_1988 [Bacteroidota bacterium]|jgi:uncharacterized protein YqgC (DUF456 family)